MSRSVVGTGAVESECNSHVFPWCPVGAQEGEVSASASPRGVCHSPLDYPLPP